MDGANLTVFRNKQGRYSWCVSRPDESPEFSRSTYDSEDEALTALANWVIF
jgi:hypothetical protein